MPLFDSTPITDAMRSAGNTVTDRARAAFNDVQSRPLQRGLLPEYTLSVVCAERGVFFNAALPPEFSWGASAHYDTPIKDLVADAVGSMGTLGRLGSVAARANGVQLVTQALTAKFWSGSDTSSIQLPCVLQARDDEVKDVLRPYLSLMSLVVPRLQGRKAGSLLEAPGPHFDLKKAFNTAVNEANRGSSQTAGKPTVTGTFGNAVGQIWGEIQSTGKNIVDRYGTGGVSGSVDAAVDSLHSAATKADSMMRNSVRNVISLQIGNYIRLPSVVITDVQQTHFVEPVGAGPGKSTGNMQRIELALTFEPFMDLTFDDFADVFIDPRVREYVESLVNGNGGPDNINGLW